jgi:hypothetical protein
MKSKGTITRARETVLAAGKSAAERAKVLAGEVANAAATAGATAKAASTAAASAVLGTVATSIQARAAKGANALAGKGPLRLLVLRKRSPKGWLLRNALHQRGRPTQRKSPPRLLKRNEYKRATSWPVRYWPKADIYGCTAHVRFWGSSGQFQEEERAGTLSQH